MCVCVFCYLIVVNSMKIHTEDTQPYCNVTCQLTRVERFSMVSLCSVRVGGPYLCDGARRDKKETQCLSTGNTVGDSNTIGATGHLLSNLLPL